MATLSAVITGGTKGIGLALVQRFASAGFRVLTCARSLAGFDAIQAQYPSGQVKAMATDMSKPEEVAAFAAFVLAEVGSTSVLINNTGVFLPGTILGEPAGNLELMINTNVYSAYHLTRALVPAMLTNGSGHIFNICSTASLVAYPNGGSYCISKFALLGMTKVLREELKTSGLRVTAVMPGATLTSSWDGVDLPEDRFMPPADVAELIWQVYSLSPLTVVEELVLRPQLGDIS